MVRKGSYNSQQLLQSYVRSGTLLMHIRAYIAKLYLHCWQYFVAIALLLTAIAAAAADAAAAAPHVRVATAGPASNVRKMSPVCCKQE